MEWVIMLAIVAAVLLLFMLAGLPIAFSLGLTGFIGLLVFAGPKVAVNTLSMVAHKSPQNFVLLAIPLFILMAELLIYCGIGTITYDGLAKVFSGMPGGLALASITMGVGMAAATGSSTASLGAIAPMAIKEMTDRRYVGWLAAGALGGAGGLAIIIPPSVLMIIYGFIAEVSVAQLFMAGLFPGILMGVLYIIYTLILARLKPEWAPAAPALSFKKRLVALTAMAPVLLIGVFILLVIYLGLTTPTEAGAVGVFASFIVVVACRRLSWSNLSNAILETARISGFALLIVVGALIFGFLMSYLRLPFYLAEFTVKLGLPTWALLLGVMIVLLFLGIIMDTISIVLIVVPIVLPILLAQGLNPIWLGIIICMNLEIALTTPPVGMNLFVLAGIAKPYGITFGEVVKGSFPYIVCDALAILVVILFPDVALWLPSTMGF